MKVLFPIVLKPDLTHSQYSNVNALHIGSSHHSSESGSDSTSSIPASSVRGL